MTVLDRRSLNRATLARQQLLERHGPDEIVARLGGLQAQEPREPYTGLWSRVADFDPAPTSAALHDRTLVRTVLIRRTVHLVTAADCLAFRGLCQPMITQRTWGARRAELPGVDPGVLADAVRPWFAETPRTGGEVARLVADRFPGAGHAALADAAISVIPLVQVPPRGTWDGSGPARLTTVDAWLGSDPDPEPDAAALVLRYLRAFGPAASADLRAWCGLTGLPAVVARLRPQLRTFRDERGRELLDVADTPLPDPDTPAPPRFLPAFDNVVLGFDDRSRIIDDAHRGLSITGARFVLVDGRVAATWTISGDDLAVHPLRPFTRAEADAVGVEGERLRGFLTGGASGTGGSTTIGGSVDRPPRARGQRRQPGR
ncbi:MULTISPECIES: winged helix DNA-binding domain-containing protein [Pseudonocardia]|uniref:Winged helix DNA-binding domain-containing protein n=2 Tax=Pseudonocardia TaxID=1847 RepID=A0A1Y2MJC6_PSEAH|nr:MULTISPECIES: winged helix DNA-binding domain-containing protein [Pseudonocardia]OSY35272.1 hypothetical protein BG845_06138 [Pseudonocardia autotrophica]TDN73289.1 winged helix DNA-binding protein [Pseudonocardia autotrophica]BBG04025.1 hypothetical protein Pdca_52340 [Pseudonocardia autotrophica]GEC27723.1 hypothetical protein PSA01_47520 [Pseudonocardia saturnea]